jgi:hypothetical protein
MVLTEQELESAEAKVLSLLAKEPEPIPPRQVIVNLEKQDVSEYQARAAIWILIDRHKIELTRDLLLRVTEAGRSNGNRQLSGGR